MSVQNFIPELWSTQLLTAFRKNLVFGGLINRNYEGEIRQHGDTVHITTPSAIGVSDYAGSVNYETPASTQQALLIDQKKYWAFELTDVDQAQANVNMMQAYMQEAAYALSDAVDQNIAGLYTSAGGGSVSIDLTATSPRQDLYPKMVEAAQNLDERNVPRTGRWVVLPPAAYAHLLKEDEFIHATSTGDQVLRTGEVGSVAGFTVYVSNNLTMTGSDKVAQGLYGTNAAITFAEQLTKTEALRRENSFNDAVRGLLLFGRKVVRPAALGNLVITVSS